MEERFAAVSTLVEAKGAKKLYSLLKRKVLNEYRRVQKEKLVARYGGTSPKVR